MTDRYIEEITSWIKSPKDMPWRVTLGSKTLIVGPSGSGKSAVIESILFYLGEDIVDQATGKSYSQRGAPVSTSKPPGDAVVLVKRNLKFPFYFVPWTGLWAQGFSRPKALCRLLPDSPAFRDALARLDSNQSRVKRLQKTKYSIPYSCAPVPDARVKQEFRKESVRLLKSLSQLAREGKNTETVKFIDTMLEEYVEEILLEEPSSPESLREILISRNQYEEYTRKMEANKEIESMILSLKSQIAAGKKIITGSLIERQAELEHRIQTYLPKGMKIALRQKGTDIEIGLKRGEQLFQRLSGNERAAVEAAYQAAIVHVNVHGNNDNSGYLIVLPDRARDSVSLYNQMEALTASDAQVIVTSSHKPEKVPEGWTLLDLTTEREFVGV